MNSTAPIHPISPPRRRVAPFLSLGLALSLALAATAVAAPRLLANPCDDDGDRDTNFQLGDARKGVTVTEDFQKSVPTPQGTWSVQGGENGAIDLRGSEKASGAFVCATIYAWAGDETSARALARRVRIVADERGVRSEGPSQTKRERWAVTYHIFVPRDLDVEVRTVNGPISVDGIRSSLDLETVNGPISILNAGGDVHGRTTNGPLDVTLKGSRWAGRGLDLESTNGPVTVVVSKNFSAELEFGTSNGPMQFDFPITVQGRVSKTIKTTLGSGGPLIRVTTVNGPASLESE